MKIIIITAILIVCCMSSCYYDSKEYLFPQLTSGCDTTNITYTLSVIPIFNNHCLSCHSNSTAAAYGANIRLENYTDVKARVDDGKLWGSISHSTGFSPMPKGSSKLNECKLSIIQKWIDKGAANN